MTAARARVAPSRAPRDVAPTRPTRLPGIEALRGVAAVCVLFLHARAVFGGGHYFGRGYLGVDFFLMLSGYLMARTAEPRLADGANAKRLLARRYRRLWPMMAAGCVLGMPLGWLHADGWVGFAAVAAANLALLPMPMHGFVFALNIPAWTVFAEITANAAHVWWLRRLRGGLLPAAIAVLGVVMAGVGAWHGTFDVGARVETFAAALPRVAFAYLIGVALARQWGVGTPLRVPPLLAIVAMPLLVVLAHFAHVRGWWFDWLFVALACPLMIAGGLRLRRFDAVAGWLGRLSFPLFALQMPVLEAARTLGFCWWQGIAAAVMAAIGAVIVMEAWRGRRTLASAWRGLHLDVMRDLLTTS